MLSGAFTALSPGATIDLSGEGQLDWGHFGLVTEWSYNHKYGVPQQITYSFITDTNDPYTYTYPDGPWGLESGTTGFTWTNGTPVRSTTTTTNGVYIFGDKLALGNIPTGFQIKCPADTSPRTLKVYIGTSGDPNPLGAALTTFSASLSGVPTYTNNSLSTATGPLSGVFTLNFQADSPGQELTVDFTSNDTSAYIFLQAATLAGTDSPPTVTISGPTDGANFTAPATFSLTATAADDGTVTNLVLLSGSTILGQSASGLLSVPLNNQTASTYSFVAVATDNGGLSVTSLAVRVYVTTNGGTLFGSVESPPGSVDLTGEGTNDWGHWGLNSPTNFDHKVDVTQQIPNVVLLNASAANLASYTGNLTGYSWSDGTPTAQALSTETGVFLYATNNPPAGFQLTVPAANLLRRLKVYTGLYRAQGRLDAWLSDFSALPYSDSSLSMGYANACAVYSFAFASPNPGANLVITWTPAATFDANFGNLTWQAATLRQQPSPPLLHAVPAPTPNQFALSFHAEAGANYTVLYADSLPALNWQVLTNFPGTGADAVIVDPGIGGSQRFYRVQVQ